MPIKQITPKANVEKYLDEQIEIKKKLILRTLAYVGESCLSEMRSNYNYQDQTGNLTSSKGYCLVVDGKVVNISNFSSVSGGSDGSVEGEKFAKKVAKLFPEGIALVIVAGMNYAYYVAAKGYNVIDSAETMADRLVPQLLSKIGISNGK